MSLVTVSQFCIFSINLQPRFVPTASSVVEKAQNAHSIGFRIMSCVVFPDDEQQFAEIEEMFPTNLGV